MKKLFSALFSLALGLTMLMMAGTTIAGTQDKFNLPEPYLGWEKSYLNEFPDLQKFLEVMITTTATQLQEGGSFLLGDVMEYIRSNR